MTDCTRGGSRANRCANAVGLVKGLLRAISTRKSGLPSVAMTCCRHVSWRPPLSVLRMPGARVRVGTNVITRAVQRGLASTAP